MKLIRHHFLLQDCMKYKIRVVLSILLFLTFALQGCKGNDQQNQANDLIKGNELNQTKQQDHTQPVITTGDEYDDDDYSVPDDLSERMREKRDNVDYGQMNDRVSYYSSTIGENKECGVLLPAGYNENVMYPVIYVLHGNGGDHYDWNREHSYLQSLYGNMLADGQARPAIVVMVDMWTAPANKKVNPTIDVQLDAYDEFYKDLENDLMPYMAAHYSIQQTREATAIIGTSQGGTEALICGFKLLDKIGYIGALAPCSGVIPIPNSRNDAWNTPVLDDFIITDETKKPFYIQLTVGSTDPWCKYSTQFYDQSMTEEDITHAYYMVNGLGHEDNLWINGLYNFIRRIF